MSVFLENLVRAQPDAHEAEGQALAWGLLSFVVVGGSAALGFLLLCNGLIALRTGLPDWLASALSYAAMIVPAYLAHRRFSFRSEASHVQALPRYVAVQLCALGLATVFSYIAYGIFGLPSLLASILVLGLTSALNFTVLRRWAFVAGR